MHNCIQRRRGGNTHTHKLSTYDNCGPTHQAELMLRCEELRDALWALCDARAEAAETERLRLAGDGCVVDHTNVLAGRYAELVQVEVDRFLETVQFLQVRSWVMQEVLLIGQMCSWGVVGLLFCIRA